MTYGNSATYGLDSRFPLFLPKEVIARICLIAALSVGILLFWGHMQAAYAELDVANLKASLPMLQQGEVTANNGQDILIDNNRYPVLPSVLVTDDEGRPRDLKEFVRGTQVRFHLRNNKIDQLVMMLPR